MTVPQDELFAAYRYHAVFTDSPERMFDAEATHRDDALFEQIIANLKDSALAHLPSGRFTANAAWLACAAIAHNLTRTATIRAQLINTPAGSPAPPTASPCTYHGTGPGNPASTSCSATLCTTPYPPPPDHRPRHNRRPQWKSRADRRSPHPNNTKPHPKIN